MMIKPKLHKVFSMLLAVLILLSAFSFKVETRLCGAKLLDAVVASKVNSCCNSLVDKPYEGLETSCCKSKVISVDGLNQVDVLSVSFELPSLEVFEVVTKSFFDFIYPQSSISCSYSHYAPPNLVLEPQLLYQTFLI